MNDTLFPLAGTNEFHLQVREGIRRAPEERVKAIKEFFKWMRRAS